MKTLLAGLLVSAAFLSAPASASLVAMYNFDNAANLGLDSSGNGNDLSVASGSVSATTGHDGAGGVQFAGGYLTSADGNAPLGVPIGNSSYGISAWFKISDFGTMGLIGWGSYGQPGADTDALRICGAGSQCGSGGVINYNWSNDLGGQTAVADNSWHNVVATYDAVTMMKYLYVDDQLIASLANAIPIDVTAANFRIGETCPTTCGGEYLFGAMDNVRIYNNALSASDVSQIFADQTVGDVPEPAMLGLFGMGAIGLGVSRRRKAA